MEQTAWEVTQFEICCTQLMLNVQDVRKMTKRDICGRWKSKSRVPDVYEDTELPYPDAKVAEKLRFGSACYYLFPDKVTNTVAEEGESTTPMMKTYILSNNVVPNIRKGLSDSAALVLGKALLWITYSPYDDTNHIVLQAFKDRI
ncbi:hypothetical protein MHU86_10466 [Fragilaria crotonensis]|nr:hypothetical protein MHU86_10466 [Fragilaria crotonensis]